jgi:MSHA pilin protein MshD
MPPFAPVAPVSPPTALTPPRRPQRRARRADGGFTLIELVVFIVVVSAALAGVLRIFTQATVASADPMQRRQALAIAESLLDEVMLMPFTFCDGDDANVDTATSSAGCAGAADAIGAEAGEGRFAPPQFDHVNDYHGLAMTGIVDITNAGLAGLSGYSARIAVSAAALGTIAAASGDALRITVTVTAPGGDTFTLDGYRSRHAPHASL